MHFPRGVVVERVFSAPPMRANLRPEPFLCKKQASRLQRCPASRDVLCKWEDPAGCSALCWTQWLQRAAGMPDAELEGRPSLRGCSPRAGPRVGLWLQVQALWRPPRALRWDFVEKIEQRLVRKGQGGCKGKGSETEPVQILAICYSGADQYLWWHALFKWSWVNNISPPPKKKRKG